jgi:prepilin-type N-terminal cleavage/methylation domain-containing protein/prepilin-type processing-associated H-X9-DG protein
MKRKSIHLVSHGITLLELLSAIAIIGVLAGVALPVIESVNARGRLAREISAGRNLIAAYHLYSTDHDGQLMEGYAESASAMDDKGKPVPNPANCRYPWRIAPYLNYRLSGTLLVNKQAQILERTDYVYTASFVPTFGINATFVGGNWRSGIIPTPAAIERFGEFCVTRRAQAVQPSQLIVFTSSRIQDGSNQQEGHHLIEAPNLTSRRWSRQYSESEPPSAWGYVHPRYNGRAVAAMMDGHVELLDTTQLQDMRRWSNQAAEADDPNWKLSRR